MPIHREPVPLEDLAAKATALGRELHRDAHAVCAGGTVRTFDFVSRTLRNLAARSAFEERDDAGLDALREIIARDLASETTGVETRCVATHFDEDGAHDEMGACPTYTERGDRLAALAILLERFLSARDETLDRVAAERALRRLLDR